MFTLKKSNQIQWEVDQHLPLEKEALNEIQK